MNRLNKDIVNKLNNIKVLEENVNLKQFPDFLILGPQRTGSTWLYKNLELHPQVFITTPKEIYFFNLLKNPDHPFYQSNDLEWYLKFYRESWQSYLTKTLKSLQKYGELYQPKVKGEATASYASMSKDLIENIVLLNPKIKAILLIRNPIMRAWSHAKKDLLNQSYINKQKAKTLDDVTEKEFEDFFRDSYQLACGDYTNIIKNWSSLLKKDHLFIGFFDDIQDCPEKLLLQTFNFLEISSKSKYISTTAKQKINVTDKSEKRDLPDRYKVILQDLFRDEIVRLQQQFGRTLIR